MAPRPVSKEWITPPTLEYYRKSWGFDPIIERIPLKKGWQRYEAFYPLVNDLDFYQVGVEIGEDEVAHARNALIADCRLPIAD